MAKGNQLGPYLVTLDEVGDPYNLKVTVLVNGQVKYQGSTSEISHKAEDVFAWLGFIAPLKPGTVMGFGTIPDCTGCDHDDFIDPVQRLKLRSTGLEHSTAGLQNQPENYFRVAGRSASHYGNTTEMPSDPDR